MYSLRYVNRDHIRYCTNDSVRHSSVHTILPVIEEDLNRQEIMIMEIAYALQKILNLIKNDDESYAMRVCLEVLNNLEEEGVL